MLRFAVIWFSFTVYNCFYDLIGSFKLDLHLTMMWLFFVFELVRGRVFGWVPWLHVNNVYIHNVIHNVMKSDFSLIKSSVLRSQHQGQGQKENLYSVWVSLHKTGWILSANWTCMAGRGQTSKNWNQLGLLFSSKQQQNTS